MKHSTLVLLATAGWASALTQQCSGDAKDEGGNWFCGAVKQIMYEGILGKGSYKAVTSMSETGQCDTEDFPYSGPLAPLDQDLSINIRGPFNLKEVAVYNLASSNKKRDGASSTHVHARRHGHQQFHDMLKQKKRAEWITATIDGQIVSWANNWFGQATDAPALTQEAAAEPVVAAPEPTSEAIQKPKSSYADVEQSQTKAESQAKPKPTNKASPAGGDWERIAYYNAEQQVADNVVFLGHYGGGGSGVFDSTWGNSLSFLNANGDGCSDSPKILKDTYIPSNKEFSIWSAEKCDESCGYARAQDVAYKGFAGANKVFLFHFKMPLDGERGFNGDMSALWMLNGRIPRTMQYGDCSCWQTGCGEADLFEVLAPGDTKCKSTFHLSNGAGSSDYFERPVDKYIKAATVFDEKTASVAIKILPDDFNFGEDLDDETVRSWISDFGDEKSLSSLFQLSN